jgi:hypothetical protein
MRTGQRPSLLLALTLTLGACEADPPPPPHGPQLFPASAPWYEDVTQAPFDAQSRAVIDGLFEQGGWGSGRFAIDFSLEVLRADPQTPTRLFTRSSQTFFQPDCDYLPIPLPAGGRVEGEQSYACASDGDCHLIVLQGTRLFEMWRAHIVGGTATGEPFEGGCLAVWDLDRDYWSAPAAGAPYGRGEQCTSADAGGLPIAPLLLNADEVSAGEIRHALRFVLPLDRIRQGVYVHPATHAGVGVGVGERGDVPTGARFRLRASFDVEQLPTSGARVVARALQRYGMFLADAGDLPLTAQADTFTTAKWSGLLDAGDLAMLKVKDFEVVYTPTRMDLTFGCHRDAPAAGR